MRGAQHGAHAIARANRHPRGLACEQVMTHSTRTQLGTLIPRARDSTQGIRTQRAGNAAAAAGSCTREQPRQAACGPARRAPTITTHASGGAANDEDVAADPLRCIASRTAVALLADGLPTGSEVLSLLDAVGRMRLRVGVVGPEGAAPSCSRSRSRCRRRARQPLKEVTPIPPLRSTCGD